jgi:hypothetical protein
LFGRVRHRKQVGVFETGVGAQRDQVAFVTQDVDEFELFEERPQRVVCLAKLFTGTTETAR